MARTTSPPQADEAAQSPKAESPHPAPTTESSLPAPTPTPNPTPTMTMWVPPIGMIARIISLTCLILSVSLLASNSTTIRFNDLDLDIIFNDTFHFNDIYAYRYALSAGVIGLSYTFLMLLLSIQQIRSGKLIDPKFIVYEFIGDKVILVLLATGVGAAFGATVDLKSSMDQLGNAIEIYGETTILAPIFSKFDDFFNRAYIPTIFLLFAFFSSAASSVLSSLALANKKP